MQTEITSCRVRRFGCSLCHEIFDSKVALDEHLIQQCPQCDNKGGTCASSSCIECKRVMCDECGHVCGTCFASYHEACIPTHWLCDVNYEFHVHCGRTSQCQPFFVPPCESCNKPSLVVCQERATRRCTCCGKLLCEQCHDCSQTRNIKMDVEHQLTGWLRAVKTFCKNK